MSVSREERDGCDTCDVERNTRNVETLQQKHGQDDQQQTQPPRIYCRLVLSSKIHYILKHNVFLEYFEHPSNWMDAFEEDAVMDEDECNPRLIDCFVCWPPAETNSDDEAPLFFSCLYDAICLQQQKEETTQQEQTTATPTAVPTVVPTAVPTPSKATLTTVPTVVPTAVPTAETTETTATPTAKVTETAARRIKKLFRRISWPTVSISRFIEEWNFLRQLLPRGLFEAQLQWQMSLYFARLLETAGADQLSTANLQNLIQQNGFREALDLLPLSKNVWMDHNLLRVPNVSPAQYWWLPSPTLVLDTRAESIHELLSSSSSTGQEKDKQSQDSFEEDGIFESEKEDRLARLMDAHLPKKTLSYFGRKLTQRASNITRIVSHTSSLYPLLLFILYPFLSEIILPHPSHSASLCKRVPLPANETSLYLARLFSFQPSSSVDAIAKPWTLLRYFAHHHSVEQQLVLDAWSGRQLGAKTVFSLLNARILIPPPPLPSSVLETTEWLSDETLEQACCLYMPRHVSDIYASMHRKAHWIAPGLILILLEEADDDQQTGRPFGASGGIPTIAEKRAMLTTKLSTRPDWQRLRQMQHYHPPLSQILENQDDAAIALQDWMPLMTKTSTSTANNSKNSWDFLEQKKHSFLRVANLLPSSCGRRQKRARSSSSSSSNKKNNQDNDDDDEWEHPVTKKRK